MSNHRHTSQAKSQFHQRNRHQGRYDFAALIKADELNTETQLAHFLQTNSFGDVSIDFSNPNAVKALNRALLSQQYGIRDWDIPEGNLCPPIPGRADYIHSLADLLAFSNQNKLPRQGVVAALDIGTGANGIYPLIGANEYQWHFVAADINSASLTNFQAILNANPQLKSQIELRQQTNPKSIFHGVIEENEWFDISMCNPPFHASLKEAESGTKRKWNNLGKSNKEQQSVLNFGGIGAELWCPGGEAAFIDNMIKESAQFKTQCLWFTCLVSKAANLPALQRSLKQVQALEIKILEMQQGQKQSRFIAWTFLTPAQRATWTKLRWK
jgi:23S rRNA (adenine1618-N6)-methyltransferase